MPSSGIFELSGITGGTGAVRSDDVLPLVDVHDATQAAQGSLIKITLAQLYRTETTAVTVSTPLPDIAQTWNNAGVTFTAVKVNVTSTASAVGSLLIDLQVAAASKFSVRKDGLITGAAGATITGTVAATILTASSTATVSGMLGVGTAATANVVLHIGGTFTIPAAFAVSDISTTTTATVGGNAFIYQIAGGLTTGASGTHALIAAQQIVHALTNGGSTVTNYVGLDIASTTTFANVTTATALRVAAPTGAGTNLAAAFTGNVTISGTTVISSALTATQLTLTTAVSKIVPGATSISHRNNADSADNLLILDDGTATHRANVYLGTGPISAIASAYGIGTTKVLTVYDPTTGVSGNAGTLELGGTQTSGTPTLGRIAFNNAAINGLGVGDNRIAQIIATRDGADNSGALALQTRNAGSLLTPIIISHLGNVLLLAGTTTTATLTIPHGSAPTSPTNGDIWTTTAGLFVRINGATVGPLT